MILLRSALFNLLLVSTTAILGVLGLPLLALDRRHVCRLRDAWIRLELALLRATAGLEHRVEGVEHLPADGRCLVASKHQSAWETLALHTLFPDPAIVLKRELLRLPLLGWYFRKVGMVPIDRSAGAAALRRMTAEARRLSAAGRPIAIYPQGTRVAPGADAPYRPGVYALYRALGVPAVPVALDSGRFWPRLSFAKRPGTITVRILPPIPPGLDRRAFMARLEDAIETASRELLERPAARRTGGTHRPAA